ncbi:hypothetical protein NE865_03835 [Phthorimaea operculella]|nr:hypothetical protein NE865_13077 [Phthorimaea operculella]KAI5644182.1 hypothetical protein NE865_03835 [Phthorimaea operculella]
MNTQRSPPQKCYSNPDLTAVIKETIATQAYSEAGRKRKFGDMDPAYVDAINALRDEIIRLREEQTQKMHQQTIDLQLSITTSVNNLSSEIKDLKNSLDHTDADLRDTKSKVSALETQVSDQDNKILELSNTITRLSLENNKQQQWARQMNVEVVGLPETKNENLYSVIMRLAEIIGAPIQREDITTITRVQSASKNHPRNIIIKLNSRLVKDKLISAARKYKELTSYALGFTGESKKIYVNEHLTPDNKQLLNKCRQKAKDIGYEYVWVKNCRIYMRRQDTAPLTVINSEMDLLKLT